MPIEFALRSKRMHIAIFLTLASLILSAAPAVRAQAHVVTKGVTISPEDVRVVILGRHDATDPKHPRLSFPGVTIRLRFTGDSLMVNLSSDTANSAVDISVDGEEAQARVLEKGSHDLLVAKNFDSNEKKRPLTRWIL